MALVVIFVTLGACSKYSSIITKENVLTKKSGFICCFTLNRIYSMDITVLFILSNLIGSCWGYKGGN